MSDTEVFSRGIIKHSKSYAIKLMIMFGIVLIVAIVLSILSKAMFLLREVSIFCIFGLVLFFLNYKNCRTYYNNQTIESYNMFGNKTIVRWVDVTSVLYTIKNPLFTRGRTVPVLEVGYKTYASNGSSYTGVLTFERSDYEGLDALYTFYVTSVLEEQDS